MQQGSSQVSSGNIAPTMGPQRDTKEVIVLAGVVLFLGGLLAAAWLYSQSGDQGKAPASTAKMENVQVSDLLKQATVVNQAEASAMYTSRVATPVLSIPEIVLLTTFSTFLLFSIGIPVAQALL